MAERSVLVTGAHGFLGRHVARSFAARGFQVDGLGHGDWTAEQWGRWGLSRWMACDVTLEALQAHGGAPALIVHCAGSSSVGFSMDRPYQDFQRTVSTAASVLEFVRTCAPSARVVFPSSGSVYGSAGEPTSEEREARPRSPYATHKWVAEQLCAEYGRRFGVASAVIRFFSLYGPGLRKQLLWDACSRIARGEVAFDGTGCERRDFVHVEDATALATIAADRASPSSPVVNGGTGIAPTIAEVVEQVAEAFPGAGRPVFTGAPRPGDPDGMVADPSQARAWGWRPERGWREGVHEYCAWFRSGGR